MLLQLQCIEEEVHVRKARNFEMYGQETLPSEKNHPAVNYLQERTQCLVKLMEGNKEEAPVRPKPPKVGYYPFIVQSPVFTVNLLQTYEGRSALDMLSIKMCLMDNALELPKCYGCWQLFRFLQLLNANFP